MLFGHPECHNIAYSLVAGGKVIDLFDDPRVLGQWLADFGDPPAAGPNAGDSVGAAAGLDMLTAKPQWLATGSSWRASWCRQYRR